MAALPYSIFLEKFEDRWFSQNNEDGIIEEIFHHTGVDSKYYVEFGAHDGYLASNTRRLREFFDWKGLLLDKDHDNPSIHLYKEFITAENINDLFYYYQVPCDLDLLSIDVDYNDFYIWKALHPQYRPRLVLIEFNDTHLPHEDKIVLYDPYSSWDYTNYYGASLLALYRLGRKKGYSLVYVESKCVNAFFIRDDLLAQMNQYIFKNTNDVEKLYWGAKGKAPIQSRYRADPQNRSYVSSKQMLKGY